LLVVALITTVSLPFGQWLMQGVLRFYPQYAREGREADLVRAISLLALGFGAVVTIIVVSLLVLGFGGAQLSPGELLAAGAVTFFSVANSGQQSALVARFESSRYSALTVLTAVSRLVLPLVLLPVIGPIAGLLWGWAIAAFLGWAWLAIEQRRQSANARVRLREIGGISREALTFGLPLAISEIGVQILAYSDRYAIAFLLGAQAVGLYSTNYSISEKLIILVQAPLIFAAHSRIVTQWEHGEYAETQHMVRNATRWLLVLGAPLVALTFVRSEMISAVLLGEEFVPGHTIMPIVALSILIYAGSQYGHKSFELSRDTWVIAASLLAAAAANLVAAVVLITRIGYMGGAIATLLGYVAYAVFTYIVSRRRGPFGWQIPWWSVLRVILAACAAAALWALLMPERLDSVSAAVAIVASGIAGLIVYAALLIITGELPRALLQSSLGMATSTVGQPRSDSAH
jgi:O-antigen/teichoic acid export membrane protein